MDRTFPNKTTGRLFPRATETQTDLDATKLTVGKLLTAVSEDTTSQDLKESAYLVLFSTSSTNHSGIAKRLTLVVRDTVFHCRTFQLQSKRSPNVMHLRVKAKLQH